MNPPTTATDAPALVDEDDVDSNDLEEMEETGFTITRRQPSLVTIEDNEDEEEEEEVPNVGTSTIKKVIKRKAHTSTTKDIPELPEAPFFDNVFLHSKPAHGGHPNLPPILNLDQVFAPLLTPFSPTLPLTLMHMPH